MRFFDAHVRAGALSAALLEHYAYFGVQALLLTAHTPQHFETSADLLEHFELVASLTTRSIEEAGITCHLALGIHPEAAPRRDFRDVWRPLTKLLRDTQASAIGELAIENDRPAEWALLERQLALAAEVGLPVLISAAGGERVRIYRRIIHLVERTGLPPDQVLLTHIDFTSLRVVLAAGCWAGVSVSPHYLDPPGAAELLWRHRQIGLSRVVLSSGLRVGTRDVLALPKAALALSEVGFDPVEIGQLMWDNGHRFIGR